MPLDDLAGRLPLQGHREVKVPVIAEDTVTGIHGHPLQKGLCRRCLRGRALRDAAGRHAATRGVSFVPGSCDPAAGEKTGDTSIFAAVPAQGRRERGCVYRTTSRGCWSIDGAR